MEYTEEYFTLETLAEFYTKAAKAGGMEYLGYVRWCEVTTGPNLNNKVSDWRPKQVPVVRYAVKFSNGKISVPSFESEGKAEAWQNMVYINNGKVIKLIEVIEEV